MRTSAFRLFALLCVACSATHVEPDARVEPDALVDAPDETAPDSGTDDCDCCGTLVTATGGCGSGVCDPWCLVDPCGGTCDYETNICVLYNLDVDAGPDGDGGVITAHPVCRPRPSECVGELMNCGGPAPDPTCGPPTGPCLNALTCWPVRIALRGNYLSCN